MTKLFIKKNPLDMRSPGNPAHYQIYLKPDSGHDVRLQIVGFSYFGEVGGLKVIPAKNYVVLDQYTGLSDWTQAISCDSNSTAIRMSYEQWFDLLDDHGINFSRVFVYPDVEASCYPVDRRGGTKYDLDAPGSLYLNLLQRYILYAQRRDIIVQICLAGVQTLRPVRWKFHPMNSANNSNEFLNTDDGHKKFCVMTAPDSTVNTEAEKNYQVQFKIINWIVNVSSWAWNVVYELFNEPGGVFDDTVDEDDWLFTVATWLDARLRDAAGQRTHLITMNAGPELLSARNNILKRMLFDGETRRAQPLIDVFSFHGDQWGGNAGTNVADSRPNPPLSLREVRDATRNAITRFYAMKLIRVDDKDQLVEDSPVALIFDSDAQYCAQDSPEIYAGVVLKDLKLDYNHRWGDFWLSQSKLCSQVKGVQQGIPIPTA